MCSGRPGKGQLCRQMSLVTVSADSLISERWSSTVATTDFLKCFCRLSPECGRSLSEGCFTNSSKSNHLLSPPSWSAPVLSSYFLPRNEAACCRWVRVKWISKGGGSDARNVCKLNRCDRPRPRRSYEERSGVTGATLSSSAFKSHFDVYSSNVSTRANGMMTNLINALSISTHLMISIAMN